MKLRLPRGGDLLAPRGGQYSRWMERQTRRIRRSSLIGATRRETAGCRQKEGGRRSLMGEMVPRCGAGAHQDRHPGESDESMFRACLHDQSSLRL